jgi:hypothetical protein
MSPFVVYGHELAIKNELLRPASPRMNGPRSALTESVALASPSHCVCACGWHTRHVVAYKDSCGIAANCCEVGNLET